MKIALIKQDVYQDLYVNACGSSPAELLFSSIARVGPIGLFTLWGADFHIIREFDTKECHAWEKVLPSHRPEWLRMLKDHPLSQTSMPEAAVFQPGSPYPHSRFSADASAIDWSKYDIVISLNFTVPTALVKDFPGVLWCYMIGEANVFMEYAHFGYDVCLTQETRGLVARELGRVDFPYSFIGPTCLESLLEQSHGRPSFRRGIFIEVNSHGGREARTTPELEPLLSTGHPLRFHRQLIRENLTELWESKYFVKIGGRFIRGNSVIEAISAGALVLMNPADLQHAQLLPKATWIESADDAVRLINRLERDPVEYGRLQAMQRERVQSFVIDAPLKSLENCLRSKRARFASVSVTSVPLAGRLYSKALKLLSKLRPPSTGSTP
ncbi:MAG: hypothetical protein KA257_11795 [Opitutaceae bacterium]|nr:hypothetical protein [Opitutaceae bacterium]